MTRLVADPKTGYFTVALGLSGKPIGSLTNVHPVSACADAPGCAIHARPTNHALKDAPMNWRGDRGILERLCEHGVGHPDADSAAFLASIGKDYENIHGCDGCCAPAPTSE